MVDTVVEYAIVNYKQKQSKKLQKRLIMSNTIKNDFRVYTESDRFGNTQWKVRIGGKRGDIVSIHKSESDAANLAKKCNEDHWHMNRGDTLADRVARSLPPKI